MILLFNPTNEDFDTMMFGGRGVPLPAGQRIEVEDSCGKHLLNNYGVRGLCTLKYGDDEAVVAEDGKRRNLEFKKKMVGQHNYRNQVRKQQGLAYTPPSMQVTSYAAELGIGMDEPYAAREKEHDRLAVLENTVSSLTKMMEMFMSRNIKEEPEEVPKPQKEKGK